jgi:hypothetical protein
VYTKVLIVFVQPMPINAVLPEGLASMVEMRSPFLYRRYGIAPDAVRFRAADYRVLIHKTDASMAESHLLPRWPICRAG